jgi:hypothetical protein
MKPYSALRALIIGISRYADPQYDLSYARSDAEALAQLLKSEFGFDPIWTLFDADATRQSIIRFFEQDLQRTEEDDGLLIFFAGHGITVTSAIGDDRGFLVPHDGNPRQPYANLSLTTIRDDYLPMIPAKHVFLVVDACYGGLALRDVATADRPLTVDDAVLAELTRKDRKVRQVLSAGTKDQQVLDGGLFGHSVFAGRLIEALREASPYITADHVGVHVRERVARDVADRRHRQTPQFGYLVGGDGSFVFHRRATTFVAPSASPDAKRPADVDLGGGYLESVRAAHALSAQRAARILNEWSLKQPAVLSPVCDHAELQQVDNLWAIRLELQVLVEDRTLEHDAVPYLADVHRHIQPYVEDIWSIPFRPPESFVKKQYSHRASFPDEIALCRECNGTGQFVCPECHGKKEVMCLECNGTGKKRQAACSHCPGTRGYCDKYACPCCHGDAKVPCTKCKGADSQPCESCGATGKVALFPIVQAAFRVEERTGHFSEVGVEWDISDFSSVLLGQTTASGADLPAIPNYISAGIHRKIEATCVKVLHGIAGRIHRTSVSLSLVPFAECRLQYAGRPFTMVITGVKKTVKTTGWVPGNQRRTIGLCVGIPLAVLCAGGVVTVSVLTGNGALAMPIGAAAIVLTSVGVLGSLGYLTWAMVSRPKPRHGRSADDTA